LILLAFIGTAEAVPFQSRSTANEKCPNTTVVFDENYGKETKARA
jgi:hypothetical protein